MYFDDFDNRNGDVGLSWVVVAFPEGKNWEKPDEGRETKKRQGAILQQFWGDRMEKTGPGGMKQDR